MVDRDVRNRSAIAVATALVALVAIGALLWMRRTTLAIDPQRLNVVMVIACTFRADQLGVYGNTTDPMPFLATRAARGTVFERNISAAPWTKPATAALITGRYPTAIGMVQLTGGLDRRKLSPATETIAERMQASGRHTVGATANPNANARFGFDQGFDSYLEPPTLWHEGRFSKPDGRTVVDGALAELGREPKTPFYLQLLLVDAHLPYEIDKERARRWDDRKFSRRVNQYRAALYELDSRLQRLVDGLAAMGHDDSDTLFVVVGDHGEGLNLPTHHGSGHGFYLYPSTVHVPLVVWGPGIPTGRRVSALTSSVDVAPTLASLVGAPVADTEGKDSSSLWTGGSDRAARATAYVSTFFKAADRAAIYAQDRMCARVYEAETPERAKAKTPFSNGCFDWVRDPDAILNVPDPALSAELTEWHAAQLKLVGANTAPDVIIDDATRDALEGLGYVE